MKEVRLQFRVDWLDVHVMVGVGADGHGLG